MSNQSETKSGNQGETKKEGRRAMELDGGVWVDGGAWTGAVRLGFGCFFLTEVTF